MLVHCGPLSPPGVDPLQVGDGVETGSRTGCGGANRAISGANVASKSNLGVSYLFHYATRLGKGFTYSLEALNISGKWLRSCFEQRELSIS